jgi:hypothetical protein
MRLFLSLRELEYNDVTYSLLYNREAVFSAWSVPEGYKGTKKVV